METTRIIEDVVIPAINIKVLSIEVESRPGSSLLCERFGEKARKELADKHAQKAKGPRKRRNPKKEYEDSRHLMPDGSLGFPAAGFFKGILDAAIKVANVTKADMRRAIIVLGDQGTNLVELKGVAQMRMDHVRLSGIGRTVDLRYRAEILTWSAVLNIEYDADMISVEQITNLVQRAGRSAGIGGWRPSASNPGPHGRYGVKT